MTRRNPHRIGPYAFRLVPPGSRGVRGRDPVLTLSGWRLYAWRAVPRAPRRPPTGGIPAFV